MSRLRTFFAVNREICRRIESYLPQARINIHTLYEKTVAEYMNSKMDQVIVDVGGGKSCSFAKYRDPGVSGKIIAVDVSEEQLSHNVEVDEKKVANIMQSLPFGTGEIDLLVSHSVLEHLDNIESFVANCARVLKTEGYTIHLFPCTFAPFALINQGLPTFLSNKILYFFIPESKGILGFPAFYNKCYYSGIRGLLEKHNFEIIDTRLSYYQSPYFNFFVPLFLVNALYEMGIRALRVKNLAAYVLIVARKRAS